MREGGYAQEREQTARMERDRREKCSGGEDTAQVQERWRREGGSEVRVKHRDCIDISSSELISGR